MSADLSGEITAIATAVLAAFAIVTAIFAVLAFLKQSREVRAIERQVKDQQELTQQQGELLKVQSGQLELQRQQMDDQREANARQAGVLELQADELRASLEQREREAADRRRAQAERVFVGAPYTPGQQVSPYAMNASELPIFGVQLWSIGSRGLSDPVDIGPILPGGQASTPALVFETGDDAMARTIITFRDTTSQRWVRLPNGALNKQPHTMTRDGILALMRQKGLASQASEDTPRG